MKRSDLFKRAALGSAGVVVSQLVPSSPKEVAGEMIAKGAVVPTAVNGNLHLHGDGQFVTNCHFVVKDPGPGLILTGPSGKNSVAGTNVPLRD